MIAKERRPWMRDGPMTAEGVESDVEAECLCYDSRHALNEFLVLESSIDSTVDIVTVVAGGSKS
jgi:hypothetical protein